MGGRGVMLQALYRAMDRYADTSFRWHFISAVFDDFSAN